MDFTYTQEQLELQSVAREFANKEMVPVAAEMEEKSMPLPKEWLKKYSDMGFLGINVDQKYGGLGLSNLEALLVMEEFAKISSAVAFPIFESCVGPVKAIEHFASEDLKMRVIPEICKGNIIVAVSMSEPNAGSALTDLTTKAELKNDKVIINGTKRWCSGGGHSEGYVVYCKMTDDPGAKGIGAVYVEKDSEGLSFGQQENLMGWNGVPSADIYFDNVEVPKENIVVEANGGFKKLMEAFDLERCGNATMCLGQASGALEQVLGYVQEREQFGKPIVEFQAVQMKLAEMAMKVEASRLLIHRAAHNAQEGFPSIFESSVGKCFCNETAREVVAAAMQLMGGYGFNKEYTMERRYRDVWGWGIAGGTIDIQKINIAASMVGRRFNQR
jgi:alkylation response protein AidB-like acyl-CoA dehydrogenase